VIVGNIDMASIKHKAMIEMKRKYAQHYSIRSKNIVRATSYMICYHENPLKTLMRKSKNFIDPKKIAKWVPWQANTSECISEEKLIEKVYAMDTKNLIEYHLKKSGRVIDPKDLE
jgi:hypothetical protein